MPFDSRFFLAMTALLVATASWGQSAAMPPEGVVTCKPMAQRTGELGCWILADQPVGPLTEAQNYWHLDAYPTLDAATAAKGGRGAVVSSLGKNWLLTIETESWQPPAGGEHIATIGPLPVPAAESYTASYMEAVFTPGMKSAIHAHPGPEAFYTMTGETCLESSAGASVSRPGGPAVIIPAGLPMQLTAVGDKKRQGFALILHDQAQSASHPVHEWTPKGLCH